MNAYQPEWAASAACRPLPKEVFYAPENDTASRELAVRACGNCPVLQSCREAALAHTEQLEAEDDLDLDYGFWALTTAEERMQIITMRRERVLHNEASH